MGRCLEQLGTKQQSWQLSRLLFADDTAWVADSVEKLCRLDLRVCERRKVRINEGKNKLTHYTYPLNLTITFPMYFQKYHTEQALQNETDKKSD